MERSKALQCLFLYMGPCAGCQGKDDPTRRLRHGHKALECRKRWGTLEKDYLMWPGNSEARSLDR